MQTGDIIVEKSPIGQVWRIIDGDKTIITNQQGVEDYLKQYNEKKRHSESLSEM